MFKFVTVLRKSRTHKVSKAVSSLPTPNIRRRWNNLSDISPTEREELLHGSWRKVLPVQITRDTSDRDYLYFVNEQQQQQEEQQSLQEKQTNEEEKESDTSNKNKSPGVLSFASEEAAMEYIMRSEDNDTDNDNSVYSSEESSSSNNNAIASHEQIPTLQSAREFFDNLACSANDEIDIDEHALSENVQPYMSDLERREEERDVNRHFFADYYIQQGVIALSHNNNNNCNHLQSTYEQNEIDDDVVYRFIDAMMRPAHGLFWINCQYPLVRLAVQHQLEQHCKHLHSLYENNHINGNSTKHESQIQNKSNVSPVVFTPSLLHPLLFVIDKMPEQGLGEVPRQVYSASCSIIAQRERTQLNEQLSNNLIAHSGDDSEQLLLTVKEKTESLSSFEHLPLLEQQEKEALEINAREKQNMKDEDNDDSSVRNERENSDEANMLSLMLEEENNDTLEKEEEDIDTSTQSQINNSTINSNALQSHDAMNAVVMNRRDDSVCTNNNNNALSLQVALQEHSCTPSLSHLYWLQRQVASNSISNVNELSILISIIAVRCALANAESCETKQNSITITPNHDSKVSYSNQRSKHFPIIVDLYGALQYHVSSNAKFGGYYMDIVQYLHCINNECVWNSDNSSYDNTCVMSKALNSVNNITLAVMLSSKKSFHEQRKEIKRQRALEKRLRKRSSASRRFDREEQNSGVDGLSLFDGQHINKNNSRANKSNKKDDNNSNVKEYSGNALENQNSNVHIPVSEQDVHLIYLQSPAFNKRGYRDKFNEKYSSPEIRKRRRSIDNSSNDTKMNNGLVDRCDVVLCTPPTSDDGVRPRILLDANNNVNKQEESESRHNNNNKITFHSVSDDTSNNKHSEPTVNKFVHVCQNATRNFTRLCAQLRHAINYAYANCENESFEGSTNTTDDTWNNANNNENRESQKEQQSKRFGWVVYATHSLNPVENEAVVCATLTQLRREEQEKLKEEEFATTLKSEGEMKTIEHHDQNRKANMNAHDHEFCKVECVRLNSPELLSLCTAHEQSTIVEYMDKGTNGLSSWSSVEGVACEHEVDLCDADIVESVASAAWRSNVLRCNADGCFMVLLRVSKSVHKNENNYYHSHELHQVNSVDEKLLTKLDDNLIISNNGCNNTKEKMYSVMTPAVYWWCQQIMSAGSTNSVLHEDDNNNNKVYRSSPTVKINYTKNNGVVCAGVPIGYISSSSSSPNTSSNNSLRLLSSVSDSQITEALISYSSKCVEQNKKEETENQMEPEKITTSKWYLLPCSISCVMLSELLRLKTIHSKSLHEYLSVLREQQKQEQILLSNSIEDYHIRADREEHFYNPIMHEVELFIRSIRECVNKYYMENIRAQVVKGKRTVLPNTFNVCFTPTILSEYLMPHSTDNEKSFAKESREESNKKIKEQTSEYTSMELHPLVSGELSSVHVIATVTIHPRKQYKNEQNLSTLHLENVPFTVTLLHASSNITDANVFNEEVEEMSVRVRDGLLYVLHKIGFYNINSKSKNYIAFLPKSVSSLQFTEEHQNRSTYSPKMSNNKYSNVDKNDDEINDDYEVLPTPNLQQQQKQPLFQRTTRQSQSNESSPFAWEGVLDSNLLATAHGTKLRKLESKLKKAGVAVDTPQNWVEQLNFLPRNH